MRSDHSGSPLKGQWHGKEPTYKSKQGGILANIPHQSEKHNDSTNNSTLFNENDIGIALGSSDKTFGGLSTERLYTGQVLDELEDDSDDEEDEDDDEDEEERGETEEKDDWMMGVGTDMDVSRSNSVVGSPIHLSRKSSKSITSKSSDGKHKKGVANDSSQYSLQLPRGSVQHNDHLPLTPSTHANSPSDHLTPVDPFDRSTHSTHHQQQQHESHQDLALMSDDATNQTPSSKVSIVTAEGKKGGTNGSRRGTTVLSSRKVSMSPSVKENGKNGKKAGKVSINLPVPTMKKGLLDQGVVYLDETDEKGNRKQKSSDTEGGVEKLTNRKLQPHYKVDDVLLFCDIFASADEDFQGVLPFFLIFSSLIHSVSISAKHPLLF